MVVAKRDGSSEPFDPVAEVFKNSDVAMVNLETAITGRGAPEPKQYHFRSPPAGLDADLRKEEVARRQTAPRGTRSGTGRLRQHFQPERRDAH